MNVVKRGTRRGATMALLAVLMPVMLGIAAFAINLVYMEMARTELQISTDIAARAAGRTLAVTDSQSQAIAAAENMLSQNPYANQVLSLSEIDIEFGVSRRESESERYQFEPGANPNAVRLATNGTNDVPMLFPTMGVNLPFRPIKQSISTKVELDVALVLDRSGSMALTASGTSSEDWTPGGPVPTDSRWSDLVNAVDSFLRILDESAHLERVALATYATKSSRDVDPTLSYGTILGSLNAYSAAFDGGSTNMGDGIRDGLALINKQKAARPWATRVLIVMSDGLANTGPEPLAETQVVAQENTMVYTVSFSDEANLALMEDMATVGAGKHFHAVNALQLELAFEDIARGLPTILTQ